MFVLAVMLAVQSSGTFSHAPLHVLSSSLAQTSTAPASAPLLGTVRDGAGLVVPGATVIVRNATGAEQHTVTGPEGRFALPLPPAGALTIIVRAQGFSEVRQAVATDAARGDVNITLAPATIAEAVTITAARSEQRMSETPASVNVIDRDQIRRSPAVVADDVLRQVPTFSLFRRTSSLSSHPTAQGVSLRGIGPSGVSRTLVLLDGVPFNDPFGGWVYWTRVPLASADRIEMVDGSSASLYGNYAMGGVINIMTTAPTPKTLEVQTQYGNRNTPKFDARASHVFGKFGIVAEGSAFDTEGYPIVAPSERGLVDTKAAVNFRNASVRMNYDFNDRVQAFVHTSYFGEDRDNGKVSTIDGKPEANDTSWKTFSTGVRASTVNMGEFQARLYSDFETFRSNFLAVPASTPPRNVGRMTLNQKVPTTGVGGMTQWTRAFGPRHAVSAGFDLRHVTGDSEEDALDATAGQTVTLHRVSGGRQNSFGFFVQDLIAVTPKLALTLSVRGDHWRTYDGHNLETNVPAGTPGAGNAPTLPERSDAVASPHVAALYHLTERVSVWGSVGTGFRAPTLNELYRQFRVGTVLTLANNQLGPEHLVGGELGVRLELMRNLSVRSTWFDNEVKDPVSNVTISTVGANVTQQRQNLGRTEIWGWQNDVEYRLGNAWEFSGGYLYNHATVTENPTNAALVGKFLPQVPKHRGSVEVAYSNPRLFDAALDVQALGNQFDDDLNARAVLPLEKPGLPPGLPKYAVVSFRVSRSITPRLDLFAGAQNLFNQTYYVGTLPTTTGTPRMFNVGVRIKVTGK